ncbi:MAG TPA: putative LPS assembly protein LptD [Vicinamibacterales bacterium]|nr:putative LPS assembly protein LptD [Vicinamibacterales bacterium]
MRRLLLLSSLCWLLTPAPASAQTESSPLANCKTWKVSVAGRQSMVATEGILSGDARFDCDETSIFADEITWDEKTLRAKGHILVIQDGLRVTAERAEMDRKTHLGTFYKAAGTARLTDNKIEPGMFGTLEPEVSFYAEKVEKIGPRTYRLTDGWFSTCVQANPRWDFRGSSGTVTLNKRMLLRNAVLRVKGVPVMYLPLIYYPMGEDDRSTGFLIPQYETSTVQGRGVKNTFFWAINRSQDATIEHDWLSKAGQGIAGYYRFVSAPGSKGELQLKMFDGKERLNDDGTIALSARRSYEARGSMNQKLDSYGRWRAFGNARYFTDVSTLQLYQSSDEATRRTRYFQGSVTGGFKRFRLTAVANQTDYYTGLTSAQRMGRLPSVGLSMSDKGIRKTGIGSRIYFGANAELAGITNQADISQPSTNKSLWRFDAAPTIRAPLSMLSYLNASGSASMRFTHWTDSLDPVTGTPEPVSISRRLFDLRADVSGPTFARVYRTPKSAYAEGFRHVIEPRASIAWLSPFEHVNNIINNDYGVDCQVGGNTTIGYSLYNRVSAKRKRADGSSQLKEIFSTNISQSYYTLAGASACDTQYQTTSVGQFSAVQFAATVSPTDTFSGRFQMYLDSHTRQPQSYSASVSAYGRLTQVSAIWTKRQFLANVPGFDNPASAAHSISGWGTLTSPGGRVKGTFGLQVDVKNKLFLQQRVGVSYGAQCCGIALDYQVLNQQHLPGGKTDHRFNISFTLAGIGSFVSPLGSFGR